MSDKKQQTQEATEANPWVFDLNVDDGPYTVLHKMWRVVDKTSGHLSIPEDRTTFFDKYTFVGGVGRDILHESVAAWVKLGFVDKSMIFPNISTVEDFEKATGRYPVGSLAPSDFTPEKMLALLGEEQALAFAKKLQRAISSNHKEGDK